VILEVLIMGVLRGVFVEVRIIKELASGGVAEGAVRIAAHDDRNDGRSRFLALENAGVSRSTRYASTVYIESQHIFTMWVIRITDSKGVCSDSKGGNAGGSAWRRETTSPLRCFCAVARVFERPPLCGAVIRDGGRP
jgi:hypothetical protein